MTLREELQSELAYVRSQIARVAEQSPTDTPTEYDTVRFMWVSRAKAIEEELAMLANGEQPSN